MEAVALLKVGSDFLVRWTWFLHEKHYYEKNKITIKTFLSDPDIVSLFSHVFLHVTKKDDCFSHDLRNREKNQHKIKKYLKNKL